MSGEGLVEVLAGHPLRIAGWRRWCGCDPTGATAWTPDHQAAAVREWLAGALDEVKIPDDTGDEWQHGFGVGCVATMREVRDRLGITGGGR